MVRIMAGHSVYAASTRTREPQFNVTTLRPVPRRKRSIMMIHAVRWTAQKLAQRLELVESLVHRQRAPIPPFRYQTLPDPMAAPPIGSDVRDANWTTLEPHRHWGERNQDFVMRSQFSVPNDWE